MTNSQPSALSLRPEIQQEYYRTKDILQCTEIVLSTRAAAGAEEGPRGWIDSRALIDFPGDEFHRKREEKEARRI